jgi:amino acid transporter
LFDMTCIGVNAIVGSSIFLFPGKMAAMVGPASVVAFGLTGLLLTTVALCFAEASSHYDQPGGPYLYTREAFGDGAGYGIGWMCWVTEILSLAAVADGVAIYLGFFDQRLTSPWVVKGTAAGVIALMGAVNYRGVKLGAWTSNVLSIAKLLPLAIFVAAGLPHVRAANYVPFAPHGWRPLGSACFLAYFAFQGFEVVPVPAGEVSRPEKNVPLAVLFSLALASVVYMLVQAVAVGVHPGLAGAERPLAEAAGIIFGPTGAALLVVGAAVSMTGFSPTAILGLARRTTPSPSPPPSPLSPRSSSISSASSTSATSSSALNTWRPAPPSRPCGALKGSPGASTSPAASPCPSPPSSPPCGSAPRGGSPRSASRWSSSPSAFSCAGRPTARARWPRPLGPGGA